MMNLAGDGNVRRHADHPAGTCANGSRPRLFSFATATSATRVAIRSNTVAKLLAATQLDHEQGQYPARRGNRRWILTDPFEDQVRRV